MGKLDNRNRDKTPELEEIESDTTPIDEDQASKDLKAEQQQAPDDMQENEEVVEEQEEVVEEEAEQVNEEELDEAEAAVTPPAEVIPEQKKNDIEDRYRESTREAQLLTERNRQLTDAFTKIDDVTEPGEEELAKAARIDGLEWEELTAAERLLIKRSYVADQKLKLVQDAVKDVKNIDEWAGKIDTFLDENETKQTHKALIGKEVGFRSFAMKASHRGLPIDMLMSHFLMTSEPTATKKGSLFLTNSGGQKPPKPKTEIDDADTSANLRVTDQREWQRQLKAGKIKIEV